MTSSLRSEKVLSAARRFLWVGVPKAATRSMLQVLVRRPPVDLGAEEVTSPLPELLADRPEIRDWFIFTFVRNPWSRVVSTWRNKVVDVNPDQPAAQRRLERFPELYPGMPFDEFVEFLVHAPGGGDDQADRHWLSQHLFLRDADGVIVPELVGRIETMADDFAIVAERLGLDPAALPTLNTRYGWEPAGDQRAAVQRHHDEHRAHYTDRTRAMVAERYADDIELFGYRF